MTERSAPYQDRSIISLRFKLSRENARLGAFGPFNGVIWNKHAF